MLKVQKRILNCFAGERETDFFFLIVVVPKGKEEKRRGIGKEPDLAEEFSKIHQIDVWFQKTI